MTFSERVPPQNLEAEQSVLGAMLIDPEVMPVVRQVLRKGDFYADRHQRVFEAICAVTDSRNPVDLITVPEELKRKGLLDDVGGLPYLTLLMNMVPTTANTRAYAQIVADKADMRRIQLAARKVVEKAYSDTDSEELKKFAMEQVQGAIFSRGGSGLRHLGEDLLEFIETNRNATEDGKPPASLIKVPFQHQHLVMPMARGETTAIGTGSNIGKTTYAFNLLLGAARLDGPAIGFSLEMSRTQILQKFWARIAGVNTTHIRHNALTEKQWEQSILSAANSVQLPLHYVVRPRMTFTDIAMEAAAFKAKHGKLSLITIDYWQILNDLPQKDERRDTLLGRLVEEAKALAVELDCHVAFLVQTRITPGQPIPTLADVLESRDIVRYVDNALFLTRPVEFENAKIKLPKEKGDGWVEVSCDAPYPSVVNGEEFQGKRMFDNVMIGVQGKQRLGPKDIIPYWIDLPTGKMADLATPWPWDNQRGGKPAQRIPD